MSERFCSGSLTGEGGCLRFGMLTEEVEVRFVNLYCLYNFVINFSQKAMQIKSHQSIVNSTDFGGTKKGIRLWS